MIQLCLQVPNQKACQEYVYVVLGVLYNEYGPPPGFCWDLPCNDEPLVDREGVPDYNMEERVQEFVQFVRDQSGYYLTNHILVTMGEDFQYQAAHSWFMNIDKLIRYINSHQEKYNINIFYSTPGVTFILWHSNYLLTLSLRLLPQSPDCHPNLLAREV